MYARYFDQQPVYEFLHDLPKDPDELINCASDAAYAETLAELRRLCDMEMNRRGGALLPLAERNANKNAKKSPKDKSDGSKPKNNPSTKKKRAA
jgi:hypothetical protein